MAVECVLAENAQRPTAPPEVYERLQEQAQEKTPPPVSIGGSKKRTMADWVQDPVVHMTLEAFNGDITDIKD